MVSIFNHLQIGRTLCCSEIKHARILVTGPSLIKVFSLTDHEELKDIPNEDENFESLVVEDESIFFIGSDKGLKQFSLPNFALTKVHESEDAVRCVAFLQSKNAVLFSDGARLMSLDLGTSTVKELDGKHGGDILSIAVSPDGRFAFSTGSDHTLKKWDMESYGLLSSTELQAEGGALFIQEHSNSLFVSLGSEKLEELSLADLSPQKTIAYHGERITRVIRLASGGTLASSDSGNVYYPLRDNAPIRICDAEINWISEISDESIGCCSEDGFRIFAFPAED